MHLDQDRFYSFRIHRASHLSNDVHRAPRPQLFVSLSDNSPFAYRFLLSASCVCFVLHMYASGPSNANHICTIIEFSSPSSHHPSKCHSPSNHKHQLFAPPSRHDRLSSLQARAGTRRGAAYACGPSRRIRCLIASTHDSNGRDDGFAAIG